MSQTSWPCTPRILKRLFAHNEAVRRREEEHAKKFPSKKEREARSREAERRDAERRTGSGWEEGN